MATLSPDQVEDEGAEGGSQAKEDMEMGVFLLEVSSFLHPHSHRLIDAQQPTPRRRLQHLLHHLRRRSNKNKEKPQDSLLEKHHEEEVSSLMKVEE